MRGEAFVFFLPLVLEAARFLGSSFKVDRLGVLAGGLPVLLDHGLDRVGPDWHGDGLGDVVRRRCSGGEATCPDEAGAGGDGEETAPGWIAWREHELIDCRRVCGWRAKHAVSLGHGICVLRGSG